MRGQNLDGSKGGGGKKLMYAYVIRRRGAVYSYLIFLGPRSASDDADYAGQAEGGNIAREKPKRSQNIFPVRYLDI